jgi:hypothetical protein
LQKAKLGDMHLGWFIGNFHPTVHLTTDFEVSVKYFKPNDVEPEHFQLIATEITVIIEGEALIGGEICKAGDIITIPPLEVAGFKAITNVSLIAIKFPSLPNDKVLA